MVDFIPEKVSAVLPMKTHFGVGVVDEVGKVVREVGNRPLVVIGGGSAGSSGALDAVTASIEREGLEWRLFEGVEPNPTVETAAKLTGAVKEGGHDVVVGVGGGSVMDASKVGARDARTARCVEVPTTSGTGSEVTHYAVLSVPSENRKFIQVDMALLPAAAVVDPALTQSCPPELTTVVGLDTLTHHIEGYFNTKGRSGVDSVALEGTRMVMKHLEAARRDGSDIDARVGMSKASHSGGVVIHFKPAGLPHGFSYSFYNILPHGSAVAILLPYCWKYYAPEIGDRSVEVAGALGVDAQGLSPEDAALAGAEALWGLYEKLGHPTSFAGVEAVDEAFIERAVNNILAEPAKLEATPRRPDHDNRFDELTAVLRAAWKGDINAVP